jgi:hypothetical protein
MAGVKQRASSPQVQKHGRSGLKAAIAARQEPLTALGRESLEKLRKMQGKCKRNWALRPFSQFDSSGQQFGRSSM